jgi:aarF domain-containing kinase
MGATRSDFVAMPFIKACETLQDDCPYEPLDRVKALLSRTLGRPWDTVFQHIDPVPLGAASIGQVHRAVLVDGRVVAVKVMYPDVERLFRGDMRTIRTFCELAQPEQLPALNEIERAFVTEFDYQREADMLEKVATNIARSRHRRRVMVPRPVKELCTKHMLVMEYLDGKKLVDALREQYTAIAASAGMTLDQLRDKWASNAAAAGASPGDRPGAPKETALWRRAALRSYLWAADAVRGTRTPMPLDVDSVLAILAAVHAHTIFVDGLYNGDSHPGNVMLLRDGRIGLIDFGQTRELSLKSRAQLARIIIALADGDKAAAVAAMRATGYRTRHDDDDMCWRMASISFDRDDKEITLGLDLQQFMEHQNEVDPMVEIEDSLVMPSRNTLLLRGIAIALGRPISVAQAWRAEAAKFLRQHPEL